MLERTRRVIRSLITLALAATLQACCSVPAGWTLLAAPTGKDPAVVELHSNDPSGELRLVVAPGIERVRVQTHAREENVWNVGVIRAPGAMETPFVHVILQDDGKVMYGGAVGDALLVDAS